MRLIERIKPITTFLCLLWSITGFAQEIEFRKMETPDGGSFSFVTGITQDKNGDMWFTTKQGLVQYDGTRMVVYKDNPLNTNSLSTTFLESIVADEDGTLWIGTLGYGLERFDPKTGIFTHYRHDPENPTSISNDTIASLLLDSRGDLYVGTHQGLNKFDPENQQFEHFKHDPNDPSSISNNQVRVLYEDSDGVLWVGTGSPFFDNWGGPEEGGLNKFDRESGAFISYLHDPEEETSLANNKVGAIYEDDKGDLWIGTAYNHLHKMTGSGTFQRMKYDPKQPFTLGTPDYGGLPDYEHITFINQDVKGNYWFGTVENGVYEFDPNNGRMTRHGPDEPVEDGMEENGAWTMFSSRDGVMWLGGIQGNLGNLYSINLNKPRIDHFKTPHGINSFMVSENGDKWFATDSGLVINRASGKKIHRMLRKPDFIPMEQDWVSEIKQDSKGDIWVGGFNGLFKWDDSNEKLDPVLMVDKENLVVGGNAGVSIFFDSKDNFWVGTGNGLCKLDEKTGEVDRIFLRKADSSYVGQNIISNILEDAMGRIWVGLFQFGGLYLLDTENKVGREYIGGVDLSELYLDKSGLVWAGTPDGLYYYDEQTDSFTRFFNPLLNGGIPEVAGIVEDDEQHLWVSSSIGLIRINPSRDELSIFDRDMGVGSYNFYWSSAYRDKEGKVYIGNDEGYFVIDPKLLSETLKAPEIRLSGFSLGDEKIIPGENSLLKQEIDKTEEILLGYDQNIFSFDFATIDYNDPENNRMIYYLENYDNNWKLANSENKAYYFNVPPGNYTFHIKGSKGVGPWTHKEISIVISPPWWQTWWAYTIYAILLALAVFGFDRFMRQRLIRIERERSREKELEQAREIEKAYTELKNTQAQLIQSEKMASLGELTAGIAHEIQNPLNFVNNFSEVSRELLTEMREELEKGDLKEAKEISTDIEKNLEKISYHGERASDIVKGMLQHSRSVGASKESTDINKLADEYFRLAYHGLRAKDKSFNAKMDTSFEEKLDKVKVIPQEMGRVILNLITNAFYVVNEKGKSGLDDYEPTVLVGTRMNENHVEVFVRDNGNGIPKQVLGKIFQPFFTTKPTGRGTGLGLSLSYDIVKAHGGELLVDTKEGEGTTFTIRIPKS